MTTLITGAGLIGCLVAARLIREHAERPVLYDVGFSMANVAERVPLDQVTLLRGDVTDLPDLVSAMQRHRVDRVVHTAGLLTWAVRERPYAGVRVNFLGTLNVLEAARLAGVPRVVFCSSNTVYLGLKDAPSSGTQTEDTPVRAVSEYPPSVYASMKLAAEWLGHCYTNEYGVEVVSVRFAGVFGPWYGNPSGGPSQLLQNVIESAYHGRPCRVTAGDLRRPAMEYVYAADAARGAIRAAQAVEPAGRVYNIAMGKLYTLPEIVALVEARAGRTLELEVQEAAAFSGYSKGNWPADLSRSRSELGFEVEFPMERAIDDYWRWLDERRGESSLAKPGEHSPAGKGPGSLPERRL